MLFHGERGIISAVEGDKLKITFVSTEACDDCGLKVVCSPSHDNARVLTLDNSDNFQLGEKVAVEEISNMELHLALAQFGLPMLLFLIGLFLGYYLIPSTSLPQELVGFICALLGLALSFPIAKRLIKSIAEQVPQKYLHLVRVP
jgi:positive regulator of sigma E activity